MILSPRPFWDKYTKWPPNDLECYEIKVPYIFHTMPSPSPKFQSVVLYRDPFPSYRSFWDNAPNDPKMTKGVKGIPHMLQLTWVPNFTLLRSTTSHFWILPIFHYPITTMINFNLFNEIEIWNFKIPDCHGEHSLKVWLKKNHVGVAFWNFHPHQVPC